MLIKIKQEVRKNGNRRTKANNMQFSKSYPILFQPILKDYVWGGRSLETVLNRVLPSQGVVAESWEISGHENGATVANNGFYAGKSLPTLVAELGVDLVGSRNQWALERGKFPLLIKLLDAQKNLSVQVHPDDAYAQANEGNELGKTEAWVVLHAEPGAEVILGVKEGTTPELFAQAIEAGDLEKHLHHVPVKAGDVVFVPAGSVHAILGGVVIAEIQQNSDTTYRVYDWHRQDPERPLHIESSLAVIDFEQVEPALAEAEVVAEGREELCRCDYFVIERITLAEGEKFEGNCSGESMEIWGCIEGVTAVIGADFVVSLQEVRFSLLPASMGEFEVVAGGGGATLLRIYTA